MQQEEAVTKASGPVYTGRVVWFNGSKGFGFISPSAGGPDIFCHWKYLRGMKGYKTLYEDDEVSYCIEPGPEGRPQATEVFVTREGKKRQSAPPEEQGAR